MSTQAKKDKTPLSPPIPKAFLAVRSLPVEVAPNLALLGDERWHSDIESISDATSQTLSRWSYESSFIDGQIGSNWGRAMRKLGEIVINPYDNYLARRELRGVDAYLNGLTMDGWALLKQAFDVESYATRLMDPLRSMYPKDIRQLAQKIVARLAISGQVSFTLVIPRQHFDSVEEYEDNLQNVSCTVRNMLPCNIPSATKICFSPDKSTFLDTLLKSLHSPMESDSTSTFLLTSNELAILFNQSDHALDLCISVISHYSQQPRLQNAQMRGYMETLFYAASRLQVEDFTTLQSRLVDRDARKKFILGLAHAGMLDSDSDLYVNRPAVAALTVSLFLANEMWKRETTTTKVFFKHDKICTCGKLRMSPYFFTLLLRDIQSRTCDANMWSMFAFLNESEVTRECHVSVRNAGRVRSAKVSYDFTSQLEQCQNWDCSEEYQEYVMTNILARLQSNTTFLRMLIGSIEAAMSLAVFINSAFMVAVAFSPMRSKASQVSQSEVAEKLFAFVKLMGMFIYRAPIRKALVCRAALIKIDSVWRSTGYADIVQSYDPLWNTAFATLLDMPRAPYDWKTRDEQWSAIWPGKTREDVLGKCQDDSCQWFLKRQATGGWWNN